VNLPKVLTIGGDRETVETRTPEMPSSTCSARPLLQLYFLRACCRAIQERLLDVADMQGLPAEGPE
jgi:hypothetical protein